jgi:hypothetical protein
MGGYTTLPKGDCDILQQDCPPGETCKPVSIPGGAPTLKCQQANGLKGIAKACASDDECQAELFCVSGACSPACCPGNDLPCNGGSCNITVQLGGGAQMRACSYAQSCMLLTPNACPPGTECLLQDPKQGLAACIPPSDMVVDEGGPCTYINDCKDSQFCVIAMAGKPGVCRHFCHPSKPMTAVGEGGCPATQSCNSIQFNFGIADLGVCVP